MFANGIAMSQTRQTVYVADSATGVISPHVIQPGNKLPTNPKPINTKMPVDNLSIDSEGDMFVAAFPDPLTLMKAIEDPCHSDVPATVFRIRAKVGEDKTITYEVTKVLEDIEGKVLPGATVAVHDAKADSFWLGGVTSPYITVCTHSSPI
jgi:arylesterase/paraoxonase